MFQERSGQSLHTSSPQHFHTTQKPPTLGKLKFLLRGRLENKEITPKQAIIEAETFAENTPDSELRKAALSFVRKLKSLDSLWRELQVDAKRRKACIHIVTNKAGSRILTREDLFEPHARAAS